MGKIHFAITFIPEHCIWVLCLLLFLAKSEKIQLITDQISEEIEELYNLNNSSASRNSQTKVIPLS